MKKRLSLFCLALVVLLSGNVADAQLLQRQGGGLFERSRFQSVSTDLLQPGLPGRLWINTNYADRGLGYEGNYLTLGGKSRLFQDRLDGRWLVEGRVHHSLEDDGGFFANVGVERVFSIPVAKADVSVGFFFDHDGDDQQTFSDGFNQLGLSGSIKTPRWDLIGNGYFPIGTDAYIVGDHTGVNCFVGNNIALQAGVESALRGFDVTLRTRPQQLAFVNGTIDIGGYQYDSDVVDAFAGGRVRFGFQILNGLMVSAEVNHDERFDTTGVLSAGWMFGATSSGFGNEWAGLARDLDRTVRNDHIVRFSQDLVLAVDPDTGLPYNVVHVDNTAVAALGDGSFETPFATLAEAEAASIVDDVIFVAFGDGTTNGYDTGIVLKDNQFLLSDGGTQFLPLPDGTLLQVSDKNIPLGAATISNPGGNEVVRLADNNFIGGINIDASGATHGIHGQGVTNGIINETNVSGATLNGLYLNNVLGDWTINNSTFNNNLQGGILIENIFDSTATFTLTGNTANNNAFDGIHFNNWDASLITLTDNITSGNARHGLFVENALNGLGTGNDLLITNHISDSNGADGIRIFNGNGNLQIISPTLTNNSAVGLNIRNWVDPLAGDSTFIGGVLNGTPATFANNGTGVLIELEGTGLVQDVLFTQSIVDSNGRGLLTSVEGENSIMNLNIIDNISFSNNLTEGIRMSVDDSGTINNLIQNDAASPLQILQNNALGSGGITYVLDGLLGQDPSVINSVVRNVNISTTVGAEGIAVDGIDNSRINLDVADSSILAATAVDINLDNLGTGEINLTYFDNVQIFGDVGIDGRSEDGTLWDFSLTDSVVQSNGILANGQVLDRANPGAFAPFLDTLGDIGIRIEADGAPSATFDNLTRVSLVNNEIRDFTFNGVVLETFGDAQMLANVTANDIINNGPGNNNDADNDGILDTVSSGVAPVNPTEGSFFDGMFVQANGNSTLTARLNTNRFVDNFQQGLAIQTTGQGTVNAVMNGNLLSNDIGGDNTNPTGFILDQDIIDMRVINALDGNICLAMTSNTFRLPIGWTQVGAVPNIRVGLDGASNGFTNAALPLTEVTPVGFGLCEGLVTAEELFFQATGNFPVTTH